MAVAGIYQPYSYAPGALMAEQSLANIVWFDNSQIVVERVLADGTREFCVEGVDYQLGGTPAAGLGWVKALAVEPVGVTFVVTRGTLPVQESLYPPHEGIKAAQIERDFDLAVLRDQELQRVLSRVVFLLPNGETGVVLPGPGDRTDTCICFDDEGNPILRPFPSYSFGFFFTTAAAANEVLCLHVAAEAFTIPANFGTPASRGSCGTNPAASFAITVQQNGATIGTITISTGGAFTFATTGGTAKAIAAGDVLKFVGPATPGTCTNVAITVRGVRA